MVESMTLTTTRGSATITGEQAARTVRALKNLRRDGAEITTSLADMTDEELEAAREERPVATIERILREESAAKRVVDEHGEIREQKPRQEALPVLRDLGVTHPYRVQLTTVTEAEINAADEEAAADNGLLSIDLGDGEIIKRQVTMTLVRH